MNFECGHFFHLYTRANAKEDKLFFEKENYLYFLRQYKKYLSPIFIMICYCLIPNHYHFLIKVRNLNKIFEYQKKNNYKHNGNELKLNEFLIRQITNFHISYSKAINKKYNRRGSLFQEKPKVKPVLEINYLLRLARYIHRNPLKHKIAENLEDWKFSSFPDYANLRKGKIPDKRFLLANYESFEDFLEFTLSNDDDLSDDFDEICDRKLL
ncbi:MAG: transposase [Candidatus Cloacimonetes bacterium]|nr:transposase [Candidatus Cloacimonadota bacterium]